MVRGFLCAVAFVGLVGVTHGQPVVNGRVYVSVTSANGMPVAKIPSDAFHVWEDGTERSIVSAEPAEAPAIVMIVHGETQQDLPVVRKAMLNAIEAVRLASPDARMAIATDVRTPRLFNVTTEAAELRDAATHYVASGAGLLLFEGIEQATKVLAAEKSDRRIIFVISNTMKSDGEPRSAQIVVDALRRAHVSLWTLDHGPASAALAENTRLNSEKDSVLTTWSVASGGMHDMVMGPDSLPSGVARVTSAFLSQYALTFSRPASASVQRLQVGVQGAPGTKIIAPMWAAR